MIETGNGLAKGGNWLPRIHRAIGLELATNGKELRVLLDERMIDRKSGKVDLEYGTEAPCFSFTQEGCRLKGVRTEQ